MKNKKEIVSALMHEMRLGDLQRSNYHEYFSKKVISHAFIGKKIGLEGLIHVIDEWLFSFPDFNFKILEIEEYDNIVRLKADISGHHLRPYQHTFEAKHSLLENSAFLKKICAITPKGNVRAHSDSHTPRLFNRQPSDEQTLVGRGQGHCPPRVCRHLTTAENNCERVATDHAHHLFFS